MRTRDGLTNRGRWRSRIGWEAAALGALLAGSAVLFLWNLAASGWANAYYTAAVQAGARDWMAFLFGSFDASNAITVDKTPASLWVMDLSVRAFGFSAWSVLAPQAVEGVLAVWLLYATVKRRAGVAGGLLAGAILALTPVAALMFRFNNPDALLVLMLVLSAYCTQRACEKDASRWWLVATRPYIGGSQHNSIVELALGYNGVGRLTGNEPGGLGNLNHDVGWGRLLGFGMGADIGWLLPA